MDVNERNALALWQAVKDLTARVFLLQAQVNGLVATIGSLREQTTALERMVVLQRAAATGSGPTEQ